MCYCSNDHLSAPLPSELLAQPQTDLDSYGFSVVLSLLALFSAACLEINYLLVLFKYASLCRDFAPSFLLFFLFFFSPFFLFFSFLFFFSLNLPPISANRCINLLADKLKTYPYSRFLWVPSSSSCPGPLQLALWIWRRWSCSQNLRSYLEDQFWDLLPPALSTIQKMIQKTSNARRPRPLREAGHKLAEFPYR